MYSILVVDIDPERLAQFKVFLEQHGFTVITANGGYSAMSRLRSASVDLVMTEISLPDIDGYDLANFIGLVRTELPVVAFTEQQDLIEGLFDRILHKSTPDRDLLQCLAQLLGPSSASPDELPGHAMDVRSKPSSH